MEPLTTIILAGGASSRMGRPKALLPFGGVTLIERIVGQMAEISAEIVVVSGPHVALPPFGSGVRIIEDDEPLQGPLAGMWYGLRAASTDLCFVCGCDLPFLRREIAIFLAERLADADGAMLESNGFPQPMSALYRKRLAAPLGTLIERGERRAVAITEHARIVVVPSSELRPIDPEGLGLIDVDTEEAYREALRRLG